jgi:hypothetical protein
MFEIVDPVSGKRVMMHNVAFASNRQLAEYLNLELASKIATPLSRALAAKADGEQDR